MDRLRQILATITAQLSRLSASHKVAIASVALLLVMALFVVAQWTSKADMMQLLPTATKEDLDRAGVALKRAGIHTQSSSGKLMVAAADYENAQTAIAEANALPADKAMMFDNLVKNNSWMNSRQQNDQNWNLAVMNEMSRTIARFKGVKEANVILDVPETGGFGAGVRKPTASATVWMASGEAMPQATVDGVAGYIAGARAGLDITRVKIIDGNTSKQRKVTSEEDVAASAYLDQAARVEAETQEKVMRLLEGIPGVIVAVTASVDVSRVTTSTNAFLKEGDGSIVLEKKKVESTTDSGEGIAGGEPGPASNQAADINRGSGMSSKSHTETTTAENDTHAGTRMETVVDPKGRPTMVAVVVNIPKGYVVNLAKSAAEASTPKTDGAAAETSEPSKQQVDTEFKGLEVTIRDIIRPLLRTMTLAGTVGGKVDTKALEALVDQSISVAMIPEIPKGLKGAATAQAGLMTALGGGSGGGLGLGSGLIEKGLLAGLGLVAMGMMVVMVRKAGTRTKVPSAEELMGLPPSLGAEADVIGEAEEGEVAMDGIEVGDAQVQTEQMLQTVSELVASNPQGAAKLLNRWINVEE